MTGKLEFQQKNGYVTLTCRAQGISCFQIRVDTDCLESDHPTSEKPTDQVPHYFQFCLPSYVLFIIEGEDTYIWIARLYQILNILPPDNCTSEHVYKWLTEEVIWNLHWA